MIVATQPQAEFFAYMMANTFQTGSVAYGIPNPQDHDRFCTRAIMGELLQKVHDVALIDMDPAYKEDMHAVKFDLMGCTYNVFVVPDNEIDAVKLVTEFITKANMLHPNADKTARVFLFRQLRELLRLWCGTVCRAEATTTPVVACNKRDDDFPVKKPASPNNLGSALKVNGIY